MDKDDCAIDTIYLATIQLLAARLNDGQGNIPSGMDVEKVLEECSHLAIYAYQRISGRFPNGLPDFFLR